MQRRSRKPPRSRSKASSATRSRRCCPAPRSPLPTPPPGSPARRSPTPAAAMCSRRCRPKGGTALQVELTGFATAVREDIVFSAGQRALINFALKLSTVQETITVAGDTPIVQTTSSEVSSTIDRQAVRNAAGQGAQLLPPADARLERGRDRHGLQRPQRRRPGGVELRHLRRWHQQPFEVADAAARAAARIERLRDRNGQGSAAHHQPVLSRVRRPLRRRVEHDHQDRHQRVERLGRS